MLLYLHFDAKTVKEPVISLTTLEKKTLINIIRGSVGAREGELFVEIEDSRASEIIDFIKSKGVEVTEIRDKITRSETCVHCGACISICPVDVFWLNEEFQVEADAEKCIRCGICINVCPVKALELPRI